MSVDISKMSIPQLQELQKSITQQIKVQQANELSSARGQVQKLAESLGISVAELIGSTKNGKVKNPSGSVPARYRNPDDPTQTWTGRGRQPNWIKSSGKTLEELLIK
ncbi:H-NS family nucleoid-associated regulatory protein [Janthinobacterium sp. FW305-128]|uniref:H-NS histone family protein n=1 Tax=Janthinobacterium sp. FW305-128 TaxID=2775055 RepID=UPI001E36375F|nr:H-NS histone family protein [Janthinobacterium sp. FW305-128]MCC7684802.1 H-NS histone family protein [Janthinobacterium sp. FW305-128]